MVRIGINYKRKNRLADKANFWPTNLELMCNVLFYSAFVSCLEKMKGVIDEIKCIRNFNCNPLVHSKIQGVLQQAEPHVFVYKFTNTEDIVALIASDDIRSIGKSYQYFRNVKFVIFNNRNFRLKKLKFIIWKQWYSTVKTVLILFLFFHVCQIHRM